MQFTSNPQRLLPNFKGFITIAKRVWSSCTHCVSAFLFSALLFNTSAEKWSTIVYKDGLHAMSIEQDVVHACVWYVCIRKEQSHDSRLRWGRCPACEIMASADHTKEESVLFNMGARTVLRSSQSKQRIHCRAKEDGGHKMSDRTMQGRRLGLPTTMQKHGAVCSNPT